MRPLPEVNACTCGDHLWAYLPGKHVALISPDDADLFHAFRWRAYRSRRRFYLVRTAHFRSPGLHKVSTVRFHCEVMTAPDGMVIDHVNRNGLDNRRSNLRAATMEANSRNRMVRRGASKFRGVTWDGRRWVARITIDGSLVFLGRFETEQEAARAYDQAASRHFPGEPITNFNRSAA